MTKALIKSFIRQAIKEEQDKALEKSKERQEKFKKQFKESSSVRFVAPGDIQGLVGWLENPIIWNAAADAVSHGQGSEHDLVNFVKMHPEFDDWSWGQIKTAIDKADDMEILESLKPKVEKENKVVLPESKVRLIFKLLSEQPAPPPAAPTDPIPDPNAPAGTPPPPAPTAPVATPPAAVPGVPALDPTAVPPSPVPAGDVGVPPIDPTAPGGLDVPGMSPEGGGDTTPEKEAPADPVAGIITTVTDMLEKTQDVPELLKAIKADIQSKFEKPEHALGVVQALADTKNAILRRVAARLLLFIKDSLNTPAMSPSGGE